MIQNSNFWHRQNDVWTRRRKSRMNSSKKRFSDKTHRKTTKPNVENFQIRKFFQALLVFKTRSIWTIKKIWSLYTAILRRVKTVNFKTRYQVKNEDVREAAMFEQRMQLGKFLKFEKTLETKKWFEKKQKADAVQGKKSFAP